MYDNEVNEQLMQNFSLLCNVVNQKKSPKLVGHLNSVEKIINEKIPENLKKNAPPDYYELYMEFNNTWKINVNNV